MVISISHSLSDDQTHTSPFFTVEVVSPSLLKLPDPVGGEALVHGHCFISPDITSICHPDEGDSVSYPVTSWHVMN